MPKLGHFQNGAKSVENPDTKARQSIEDYLNDLLSKSPLRLTSGASIGHLDFGSSGQFNTPGWEQLSKAEQMLEFEGYIATYPDSPLARKWRAIEALSDVELEALVVTLEAQLGEPL